MQLTQLLPVIALSISVALAGHDENVMLCNCRDGNGVLSSQMAYYSGDPNSSPQALANVDSDFGKTVVWEGGRPVEGAFADTDVFTSVIAKPVGEGAYAGTGNNKYGPFFCYRNYRENLYTSDGKTCSSIYACNHRAPGVDIAVSVPGADYVEMDGWHNPRDILWAVWAKRLERSCDESPYDLGNGCQIQFSCHGDIPWATTNGMATTLVDVVSKQKDLVQQQAVKKRVCTDPCTENPGPKRGCCGWETQTIWTTKMARSVEIYVSNADTQSDQGSLRYELSCPVKQANCGLAKLFSAGLSALSAAVVPELFLVKAAFGVEAAAFSAGAAVSCG